MGRVSAIHTVNVFVHFLAGGIITLLFLLIFTPVVKAVVGWHGVDSMRGLGSLEVLLPFIGAGFLVTFLNSRMKVFWFAVGFLVTVVLSFSIG